MSVQPLEMAGAPSAQSGEVGLANLLGAFRRRWRTIAVSAGVALVLAMVVTALQTPVYSATTLIMVDWRNEQLVPSSQAREGVTLNPEILDSEIELLRSRALLGRLADVITKTEAPAAKPKASLSLARALGVSPRKLSPEEARESLIDDLEQKIKIKRRRLSYIIEVRVTDADPKRAAFLANSLASLYLDSQFETRVESAGRANTWLAQRLQSLKDELALNERAIEDYRATNGLIASSGSMLTDQQASGLQSELVAARAALAEKTARYRQLQAVIAKGGSVDTVGAVVDDESVSGLRRQEGELSRKLAELESRFRDEHPAVKQARAELANVRAQIDQETRRIVLSIRNDVEAASARVAALSSVATGVRDEIKTNNRTSVRLRELEREAAAKRAVYEGLLQRANEMSQQETLKTSDVRVVAKATPPRIPSAPIPMRNLVLGVLLGIVVGVGIAAILELLDTTVAGDAEDVERLLNLSVLSAIPRVKKRELATLPSCEANPAGFLIAEPMSAYAEALQALRAALELCWLTGRVRRPESAHSALSLEPKSGRKPSSRASLIPLEPTENSLAESKPLGRVVAITSALSGDGKTTTAVALVRAYALSGRRAVLVECDLRRQAVAEHLHEKPSVGLVHALTGAADLRATLFHDRATSACFVVANAPRSLSEIKSFALEDIFTSRAMAQLLQDLREEFELVVLDCPPALVATEALALGRVADACVLITRVGKTPKASAQAAIKRLSGAGANLIGVALNGVLPTSASSYYGFSTKGKKPASPAPDIDGDNTFALADASLERLSEIARDRHVQ